MWQNLEGPVGHTWAEIGFYCSRRQYHQSKILITEASCKNCFDALHSKIRTMRLKDYFGKVARQTISAE
jgi:hypothetical protein